MKHPRLSILHVSLSSPRGGAAIGAKGLHQSLREVGIDSRLLQAESGGHGAPESVRAWRRLSAGERLLGKISWRLGLNDIHALGTKTLLQDTWFWDADLVHLHNLHGGGFNYLALPAIAARKPLVWTLHDMWPITGHCGFSLGCERWRYGCGGCPHPEIYPYMARDASRWEWRWKRKAIRKARPVLVAPSRWLAGLAGEAFPELDAPHQVPYSIDTGVFRPFPTALARRQLGLPEDRCLLLSAASDLREKRKGAHLLREALLRIPLNLRSEFTLLTLGSADDDWQRLLNQEGISTHSFGFVEQREKQAQIYSAADLLLFPSMDDNLPFVILEALACGLPVLAFAVGGMPEMIESPRHGQVVPAFDVGFFAGAVTETIISWELAMASRRSLLPLSSAPGTEGDSYRAIYEDILYRRRVAKNTAI